MKKLIVALLILLVGMVGFQLYKGRSVEEIVFGNDTSNYRGETKVLLATTSDAQLLPAYYVFDDTTTTAGFADGGLLTQKVSTADRKYFYLDITAVGSVSTSTIYIRPMVSLDGIYFSDIATSSTSLMGTTTANITNSFIRAYTPGTATSSKRFEFPELINSNFARFVIYSDRYGDLNLGTQAFITAILKNDF